MVRSRAIWLGLGAVVILGGLLYLFLQVTADPTPSAASPAAALRDDHPAVAKADSQPEPGGRTLPGVGVVHPPATTHKVDLPAGGTAPPSIDTGDDSNTPGGDPPSPDVDLDAAMDEANKLYDHNDYEAAVKQAQRVLDKHPESVRMLRIVVSSACMMGDTDNATKYFGQLPARDQGDMSRRCARFDIKLEPTKPALPAGGRAATP